MHLATTMSTDGEKESIEDRDRGIQFLCDICVHSSSDDMDCGITGMIIMPNNNMIVSDYDNAKVKVIALSDNKLIQEMELTSGPTDLAMLSDTQIAIALPDESKVLILETEPDLVVHKELHMEGKCWGVSCSQGRLVVTLQEPDGLHVIDMEGNTLHVIDSNSDECAIFSDPECTAVTPDHQFLFISNYGNDTVIKLDWNGRIVASYSGDNLKYPGNVVFYGYDRVLVSGYMSDTVVEISQDCKLVRQVLDASDGIDRPASLTVDSNTSKLYVGMKANEIKVFQLS